MSAAINPITGPGLLLETLRIVTPLGIQFWDLALNQPIAGYLTVNLWLPNSAGPVLNAVLTNAGVYAFFGLPGLRAVEYPIGTQSGGNASVPPQTFTYIVTVQDTLGLYLPAVLVYTLDQTGTVLVNGEPDPTPGPRTAYLFSAPTRTAPAGFAAVSAYLIDHVTQGQAAWALVSIQVGSDPESWTGIADNSGRALVLVPFPIAQNLKLGSPPGTGQGNIAGETWPLSVEVQYSPDQLTYPLAKASDVVYPWTLTPNLKDILSNQQQATIWSDPSTPVTTFPATLTLGQNLVLRSATNTVSPISYASSLNISRGTSPV
jgi:hypothetical protein